MTGISWNCEEFATTINYEEESASASSLKYANQHEKSEIENKIL